MYFEFQSRLKSNDMIAWKFVLWKFDLMKAFLINSGIRRNPAKHLTREERPTSKISATRLSVGVIVDGCSIVSECQPSLYLQASTSLSSKYQSNYRDIYSNSRKGTFVIHFQGLCLVRLHMFCGCNKSDKVQCARNSGAI